MELQKIQKAAEDIGSQAATGPGPDGSRVANILSPHFIHYTTERIRSLLIEEKAMAVAQLDALFDTLNIELDVEDKKLAIVVEPDTHNVGAVRAVALDAAQTRKQLIEGLQIQLRALIRQ